MKKTDIYIIAYCCNNLGDDLFVRTLIRRYPNKNFYIFANPKYTKYLSKEKNVRCEGLLGFYFRLLKRKIKPKSERIINETKMKQARAVVQIGGSIFIERPYWKKPQFEENYQNKFFIGCNFGPYYTETFFEWSKKKIASTIDCCFRDMYSYHLFDKLPNVRFAPDVLFGCRDLPEPQDGDQIGISVIDMNMSRRENQRDFRDTYECGIAEICKQWIARGKKVKLLSFCEAEGDTEAVARIQSLVGYGGQQLMCCSYTDDIDEFLREMNSCEIIYATRFHAMILGWIMRKKVFPVVYSPKQKNVMDDISYCGTYWDVLHAQPYDARWIDELPKAMDRHRLSRLTELAQAQFQGLDLFLKNEVNKE